MSRAIILQHVDYAGPGRIVPVFRDFGIQTEVRHLYKGDEVPTDLEEIRILITLGGPMGVKEASGDTYKYNWFSKEIELLKRLIAADRPVLGIALGAQLLAHAAGAKVYPNAKPDGTLVPEYGWHGVNFPFPGGTEPVVGGMIDGAPMFHWHKDTFDLPRLPAPANAAPPPAPPPPAGNSLLSTSKLCKNQAFRFKNRLFGFQYHFEWTPKEIEATVEKDRDSLIKAMGNDAPAIVREQTSKLYPRHARLGDRLLSNFVQFLHTYAGK